MKIVTLYESAQTDGYTEEGTGKFFLDEDLARAISIQNHGGYAVKPLQHNAIEIDGKYLLLKSSHPVILATDTERLNQRLRENALSKLTSEEIEVLGLTTRE